MNTNNNTELFELNIPSNPDKVSVLESFVDEIRQNFGIKEELFGNILITLTEAVNNSIIHGNKTDESKKVKVSAKSENNTLIIKVSDEGEGFDYNNLPDPTNPENLEKLTGRGVFLMNQLSDLMVFSDGGSTVELHFKI
ncbi:MAG: ATP-binding protein [Chitinophagales bacterium]